MRTLIAFVFIIFTFCTQAKAQDYSVSGSLGLSQLDSGATRAVSIMGSRYFEVSFFRVGAGVRFTNWQRNSDLSINSSYTISKLSVSALNLAVLIEADVFSDFVLGFNIDAFGTSFGDEVDIVGTALKAKPYTTNILLGGKPDRGSLNSEYYLAYKYFNYRFAAGFSHQVTEYRSSDDSTGKLQRFFDTAFFRFDYFF